MLIEPSSPEVAAHESSSSDLVINYDIAGKYGQISCIYAHDTKTFLIADFQVSPAHRRQGVGKDLLRSAVLHARNLGASMIATHITSRESLDAMRSVFGEDSITVTVEGDYGQANTAANLNYQIPPAPEASQVA